LEEAMDLLQDRQILESWVSSYNYEDYYCYTFEEKNQSKFVSFILSIK
jgi:hypothetical protein